MKPLAFRAALGLASAVSVSGVHAQAVATSAGEPEGLEKIVISAQRRDEAAQDVGLAVSVISGKTLTERGVTSVNQLQNHTPSLEVEPAFGSGQPEFRLRGIGFHDYASNNTSTVLVNVDDVAYGLPILTQGLLFDIDRVEVLRGPQGTLYGRNTTGGAVNFISRRPTHDFSGGVTTELGTYGAKRLEGFVSGPFSETVRGRFAVATEHGGAWQKNRATGEKLGDADRLAVRGQLEWDVTTALNVRLTVHAAQDNSDGTGLYLFKPFATAGGAGPTLAADTDRTRTGWGLRPAFAQIIGTDASDKPFKDNNGHGTSLVAQLDLGDVALTSITAVEKFKRRELNDWDASASAEADEYFHSDVSTFSQELRLASRSTDPLQWVVGAYYGNEKLDEIWYSDFADVFGFTARTAYHQRARSTGLFGQVTYALTPSTKLVGGLRSEHERRTLDDFSTTTIPVVGIGVGTPTDRALSTDAVSGKVGVEHRLNPRVLTYAHVSRGVKSGGFTAYNTLSVDQLKPFDPETLYAYEAGVKSDLSSTLRLNAAVFHYDYRNQQVQSAIFDSTFGAIGKIVNAPRSKIDGVEVEAQWEPSPGLTIAQSFSYKEGKYREFRGLNVAASLAAWQPVYDDYAGKKLNFPKLGYGGAISYQWAGSGYRWKLSTDYSYHDDYASWLGTAYDTSSYWLANVVLSVGPSRPNAWTASLWGRNVFNAKYDLTRNFFTNAQVAAAGAPATWGVQVNYPF